MTDSKNEPDTIAMLIPDDGEAGARTLVRVRYGDDAEVAMPVSTTTAARLIAEWEGAVKDREDARYATRHSVVESFRRGSHLKDNGVTSITAAVLYLALNSANGGQLESVLEAGGWTILAQIDQEGEDGYRFRLHVEG